MLPANRHLLPIIGIDIHMIIILGAPVPIPHPFIGLVFDPMDWVPKIGSTVRVNSIPRGNSGTGGMLGSKVHIPMGGPFAMPPTIGHDAKNFFGSPRVKAEGSYFSGAGFMLMSCNDIGMPLSITPGKKFKPVPTLYLPTSAAIPIPAGKPVIVGGPYVPDLMGLIMGLVMSFGFGAIMKVGGALAKKALTKLNQMLKKKLGTTNSVSKFLCKHGFEPVNLITGSVLYEATDFELPGPIPVQWGRTWYSDSDYVGLLGHGTHLTYDLSLIVFSEDNAIGVILPDGRSAAFPLLVAKGEKYYHRSEKLTLTCNGKNNYHLFNHRTRLIYSFEKLHDNIFKPVTLSNASGLALQFFYNSRYCLEKIIDTAGREIFMQLDAFDRIISVEAEYRGEKRKFVEYQYNEAGDLSATIDTNRNITSIRYENHLMVEKTDRNGQTFYWEYDGHSTGSRCIHTYGDGGIFEGWIEYNKGHNVVTNSLGETRIYYYDENNLCIQETDALGNSVFHQYTDFMEPYREIDEEGNVTGYLYDDRGNLAAHQKPDGSVTSYLHDESGKLLMVTDAEGKSAIYTYKDDLLKAMILADKSVTCYEYNDQGLLKVIQNGKGQKTFFNYDTDYNLAGMTLPGGGAARWQYDVWARCIATINPENQSQQFEYDLLDRVIEIRKRDGSKLQLRYDAYDRVTYAEDADRRFHFEYTPLGNLKMREENGAKVQLIYDTAERLICIVNEHNEVYRFAYNKAGKIIQETGFDGLKYQYIRDRAGKLIKVIKPGERFTEYEYDLSGQLIRAEHSDGSWQVYNYNRNGQVIEAVNQNSRVIIDRDSCGRVIKEDQDGHTIESKYDELGKRIEAKSSLGAHVKIERNEACLVRSITTNNLEGISWEGQYKYNALGMETERFLPGGIISLSEYDSSGHVVDHSIRKNNDKILRHRTYTWNVNDRLRGMMNGLTNGLVRYNYDDFGNLAWAKYEDNEYDYRMPDKVGNLYRTRERNDRKYSSGGRLLVNNGTTYNYDEEGNLLSKTSANGKQWKYKWSGYGMLEKVIRPDEKEVCFEYDALGRRTAKIYNGYITRWVWDGNRPLHEWKYPIDYRPKMIVNENGEVTKDKPESTEDLITWIFDEGTFKPAAKLTANNQYSIITNYLGTPVETYDSQGKQVWSVEYDIYGKIRMQSKGNTDDCPFRFQGQYEDIETGLYYNRFRYYSPDDGLYLSRDRIGILGGLNSYSYVKDPNFWLDQLGLNSSVLNRNLGGVPGDHHQAHHLIPEQIWTDPANQSMFDAVGMDMDAAQNGILLPDNEALRQSTGAGVYHSGSHPQYSAQVDAQVAAIRANHVPGVNDAQIKTELENLQNKLETDINNGNVPLSPHAVGCKLG